MIPLRDSTRAATFPFVTITLIAVNILIFVYEIGLGEEGLNFLFYQFGFIPATLSGEVIAATHPASLNIGPLPALFTSMFLHGSLLHIAGNMLFLWIFGDNVEDRFGHLKYLLFYLAAGIAAALTHYAFSISSAVPTIGASGAIAGVMGAYILMYPRGRVTTLIILGFYVTVTEIPAIIYLGLWFALQVLSGLTELSLSAGQAGGVAWFAHVGGFIAGIVAATVLGGRRLGASRRYTDD